MIWLFQTSYIYKLLPAKIEDVSNRTGIDSRSLLFQISCFRIDLLQQIQKRGEPAVSQLYIYRTTTTHRAEGKVERIQPPSGVLSLISRIAIQVISSLGERRRANSRGTHRLMPNIPVLLPLLAILKMLCTTSNRSRTGCIRLENLYIDSRNVTVMISQFSRALFMGSAVK